MLPLTGPIAMLEGRKNPDNTLKPGVYICVAASVIHRFRQRGTEMLLDD